MNFTLNLENSIKFFRFFVSAYDRDWGSMTTTDGSHFDVRTQFRGFFAMTWNDTAEGPQRGPLWGEGAYYGSLGRWTNSSRRIRGLRETEGASTRVRSPNFGSMNAQRKREGGEDRHRTPPYLRHRASRASFLMGDWTRATRTRDVFCTMILDALGLCVRCLVLISRGWHFLFAWCDNRTIFLLDRDVLRKLSLLYLYLKTFQGEVVKSLKLTEIYFDYYFLFLKNCSLFLDYNILDHSIILYRKEVRFCRNNSTMNPLNQIYTFVQKYNILLHYIDH